MALPIITPLRKRPQGIYKDFRKDLTIHPITNDLAIHVDEDAVKESLTNLMMTDRGERLMQPTLGSDIRATLFDNSTPATLTILKQQVKDTINSYEPRCTLIDVQVLSEYDDNTVIIKVLYYIRNKEIQQSLTVFLERNR